MTRQYELYTYLKDGTELCRMVGLLVKQRVLDGVIYRPNNISCLEENNLNLFINFVETEFKVKDIFGVHGTKVFHKFSNFFVVLSGLAKLSKEIQRKFEIPKFVSSGKKTEVAYQNIDYKRLTKSPQRQISLALSEQSTVKTLYIQLWIIKIA